MLNLKDLSRAVKQVADEKGLPAEKVLDAIESSIAAAYKKEYGERGEVIRAKLDLKTGELRFWRVKTVVDASTVRFVGQEEAEAEGREEREARQRLRESERESILAEWRGKEGQIVSGAVQRFERGHVYVDLGRATGVMFANESIPGEHYRTGERLRF